MQRFKLTVEYDGTGYLGWQRQPDGPSIQQALEDAISQYCGQHIEVTASGRTDAGVHARGQVAHVDLAVPHDAFVIRQAINHYLKPQPISILQVEPVPVDFHARFSTLQRRYQYLITNRYAPLALDQNRSWLVHRSLNVDAMQVGARYLLGHHDFSSFRAAACQANSPLKTIDSFEVSRHNGTVIFEVAAKSFLHHQVRNMVGTLKLVGLGQLDPQDIQRILESRDRKQAGPTAPAQGLYFMEARYPASSCALQTKTTG